MAKVEPWFTPRDEDGDDQLLNQLGRASKGGPPKGGGCVVLVLAGAAAGAVAFLAPVVVR